MCERSWLAHMLKKAHFGRTFFTAIPAFGFEGHNLSRGLSGPAPGRSRGWRGPAFDRSNSCTRVLQS